MKMKSFLIAVPCLVASLAAFPCLADAAEDELYAAVFEPQVVAEPPCYAHRDLVQLPNGELRHGGVVRIGGAWRPCAIVSNDRGLSWKRVLLDASERTPPMIRCTWADYSLGFVYNPERKAFDFVRSASGLPGAAREVFPSDIPSLGFERLMPPFGKSRTWAFAGAVTIGDHQRAAVALSKDDGRTWRLTVLTNAVSVDRIVFNDRARRWNNGCCEPTVAELSTGELLMVCRATLRHHYAYRSKDGGRTWSGPEAMPGFYSSNTMPTLLKLRDGRLLFFWNNTEPLAKRDAAEYPELMEFERNGVGETVFTNRDALHAAISEDDGRTWTGFREVALSEIRNRPDYREYGTASRPEIDKSVHQSQAIELPGGKILLAYGQGASRRMCLFDVRWLYEKGREETFRNGLEGLSNHLFLRSLAGNFRGWSGHCAFNRIPGAVLVREPAPSESSELPDCSLTRECLQICRVRDERLVSELQGVAWNFPAAKRGQVELVCRIDGEGFRFSLCDRWIAPGDEHVGGLAAASAPVDAELLGGRGRWAKLVFSWDWAGGTLTATCEGRSRRLAFSSAGLSPFGPSYMHLQTLAREADAKGSCFRSFRMTASSP